LAVFSSQLRCQRLGNHPQNAGRVLQDFIVPEAENPPTGIDQGLIADNIGAGSPMLTAIGFDNQPSFNACEIHHIGRDRILPSKTSTYLFVP